MQDEPTILDYVRFLLLVVAGALLVTMLIVGN